MDRTRVCGTRNPGSIPGEGTNKKTGTFGCCFFVCALTEQSGGLFVRNRSPIELDFDLQKI